MYLSELKSRYGLSDEALRDIREYARSCFMFPAAEMPDDIINIHSIYAGLSIKAMEEPVNPNQLDLFENVQSTN